jgi:TonB family protein
MEAFLAHAIGRGFGALVLAMAAIQALGGGVIAQAPASTNPPSNGSTTIEATPDPGTTAPQLLLQEKPKYTRAANIGGIQGIVVLECLVQADGSVGDIRVVQSLDTGLDGEAIKAVRQWRFAPARRNGQAVPATIKVNLSFKLTAPAAPVAAANCALGGPALTRLSFAYSGADPIAIGVRDEREDVVTGQRKETLIGHQRSLYGIPYPTYSASGKSFADELAAMIASGLAASTVRAVVSLSPFKPLETAVQALAATGADRLLLFRAAEWNADTYARTTLQYKLDLMVLSGEGHLLGQSSSVGEVDLRKDARPERQSVCATAVDLIQTLISDRSVVMAVAPNAKPAPVAPRSCTVEQILTMKEAGLSQAQIEAACAAGR